MLSKLAGVKSIVGLDLSYSGTGICQIDCKTGERSVYFCSFDKKQIGLPKIERASMVALEVLRLRRKNPVVYFIEDYAFGSKKGENSLTGLGELGGVVKLCIWRATGAHAQTVAISQWKKFLCNQYQLNKDAFKLEVYKKFGVDCGTNDEAAAVAIADYGYHILFGDQNSLRTLKKYETETIQKYRKAHSDVLVNLSEKLFG